MDIVWSYILKVILVLDLFVLVVMCVDLIFVFFVVIYGSLDLLEFNEIYFCFIEGLNYSWFNNSME